jgi:CRISPR system Cascade subunit CasE
MFMTKATLRFDRRGSAGSLAAFLAGATDLIGQAHHVVWSLFGDKKGTRNFVFRQTGSGLSKPVLLYSPEAIIDKHGLWDIETKPFELPAELRPGEEVAWAIRVNPTIKRGNTKHDVVALARARAGHEARAKGETEIPSVEETAAIEVPQWLLPRLERAGLAANTIHHESHNTVRFCHGPRGKGQLITMALSDLHGTSVVHDTAALLTALATGIGPGKAYGCGMLLLRRAS